MPLKAQSSGRRDIEKYEKFHLSGLEYSIEKTCKSLKGKWISENVTNEEQFELYTFDNLELLEQRLCYFPTNKTNANLPYKTNFFFDKNGKVFGMANYYNFKSWNSRNDFLTKFNTNINSIFSSAKKLAINFYKLENTDYSVRILLNDSDTKSFDFYQGEARPVFNYFLVVFITK